MPSSIDELFPHFEKFKISKKLLSAALNTKPEKASLEKLIQNLNNVKLDYVAAWQIVMLSGDLAWIQQELPNFVENTADNNGYTLAYYAAFTADLEITLFILNTFPNLFNKKPKTGATLESVMNDVHLDYKFVQQEMKWISLLATCNSNDYNLDQALIDLKKLSLTRKDKAEYQRCIEFHLERYKRLLDKKPALLEETIERLYKMASGGIDEVKQTYIDLVMADFADIKKTLLYKLEHPEYKKRTPNLFHRLKTVISYGAIEALYDLGELHMHGVVAYKSVPQAYRYFFQGAQQGEPRCQKLFSSPLSKNDHGNAELCFQLAYFALYQKKHEYLTQAIEQFPKEFEDVITDFKLNNDDLLPLEFIFRFYSIKYQTDTHKDGTLEQVANRLIQQIQRAKTPKEQLEMALLIRKFISDDLYIHAVLGLADEFKHSSQIRYVFLTVINRCDLTTKQRAIVNSHLSFMPSTFKYLYPLPAEQKTPIMYEFFQEAPTPIGATNSNLPYPSPEQAAQNKPV